MRRGAVAGMGLVAVFLCATSAAAQVSAPQRVQITDPGRLEAMGFAPNATNVFELIRPANAPTPVEVDPNIAGPNYFGSASGFTTAGSRTFFGRTSSFAYDSSGGEDIYNTNPATENVADAYIDIPNGAVIEAVRVWWSDTSVAHDLTWFFIESCQPIQGAGAPVLTTLSQINSSGSAGAGTSVDLLTGITANSDECTYRLRARFGSGNLIGPGDSSLTLNKGRIQWRRAVSAAPGTATFNDVPTTHPFFRFVEALVSAGITGGCGGGNFCPDGPLTRGEMAVFLAAALGLNFGF